MKHDDEMYPEGFLDDEFARFRAERLRQRAERGARSRSTSGRRRRPSRRLQRPATVRAPVPAGAPEALEPRSLPPPVEPRAPAPPATCDPATDEAPADAGGGLFFGTSTFERSRLRAQAADQREQRELTDEEQSQARRQRARLEGERQGAEPDADRGPAS